MKYYVANTPILDRETRSRKEIFPITNTIKNSNI